MQAGAVSAKTLCFSGFRFIIRVRPLRRPERKGGDGSMRGKREWDLYALSASRPSLLGLATLWIALFHSYHLYFFQPFLSRVHLVGLLNRLKESGNCGVDIFLFLSGFGLYFSLTRLREGSAHPLGVFYRHRFSRVLPAYLIVSVLYYGLIGTKDFADWMGKIFLYGFYSPVLDGGRYWYFALLFPLYLLFPLIWRALERWDFPALLAMLILSVSATMLLRAASGAAYFGATELIWTRVPVFLLGAWFGKLSLRHVKVPVLVPALSVPLSFAVWILLFRIPPELSFLRRYAYGLLTVLIALGHGWLCSLRPRGGALRRAAALIGACSLEIYLIYENLYLLEVPFFRNVDSVGAVYALTTFVAALLLSVLLRTVIDRLRKDFARFSPDAAAPGGSENPAEGKEVSAP